MKLLLSNLRKLFKEIVITRTHHIMNHLNCLIVLQLYIQQQCYFRYCKLLKKIQQNAYQRKTISSNGNFKERPIPQVVVNEFPERQDNFQRYELVPCEQSYRLCNSNNIIVFSDSITIFKQNRRSNFNNLLKESRGRFKCFPGATSSDLLLYIERQFGEGQFDTAIIHVGINALLSNTTVTEG